MSTSTDGGAPDALPADQPTALLIGGAWRSAGDGATFEVRDPATGEVLTRVADAGPADAAEAMEAMAAAAPGWAATAPRDRAELLRRTFDLLQQRADDVAAVMTAEMGKPLVESRGELTYGAEFLRWFGEEAVRITGRYGLLPEGTGRMLVSRRPVGPAYLITPWNFPLAMATRKIGPALAAGCPVVLKPAAETPLTSLLLAELLQQAGAPPGVVNVLPTTRTQEVSAAVIEDVRLRKLSFTGSTAVGRTLIAQSAGTVLRTSMELGGNAPFLVFADADLDAAADGAMIAKFRNIGQACTAANRFVVEASVADAFADRILDRVRGLVVGPGARDGVTIGPLITAKARRGVLDLVDDAVERGARLLCGGSAVDGPGYFVEPTVLTGVATGSRLLREEIFGPVLAISTFDTEEQAVTMANDTEYGLISYAYTRDLARAHRVADALVTGMTGINTGLVSNAAAPFGGVKQSGIGREGSVEGIAEYLETKYTLIPV